MNKYWVVIYNNGASLSSSCDSKEGAEDFKDILQSKHSTFEDAYVAQVQEVKEDGKDNQGAE